MLVTDPPFSMTTSRSDIKTQTPLISPVQARKQPLTPVRTCLQGTPVTGIALTSSRGTGTIGGIISPLKTGLKKWNGVVTETTGS